jgi:drug/metabolite transporter (DMT)-like permease
VQEVGEAFALTAAMLWTVSSFLFRAAGASVSPILLNSSKGILAIAALSAWLCFSSGAAFVNITATQWIWLLVSGAIGIGIGDTAFFAALNRIGEQRAVLIAETSAPPMTVLFAFAWMNESLSPFGFVGIALTLIAVTLGLVGRKKRGRNRQMPREPSVEGSDASVAKVVDSPQGLQTTDEIKWPSRGVVIAIGLAFVAAACQSFGAVISRWLLGDSDLGPIQSSLVRMIGGQLILMALLPFDLRRRTNNLATLLTRRTLTCVGAATLLGTILGIVCQQASLKYTSAGISQTLIATSVLLVLPISWILGNRPTSQQCWAAIIGVAGVAILCLLA